MLLKLICLPSLPEEVCPAVLYGGGHCGLEVHPGAAHQPRDLQAGPLRALLRARHLQRHLPRRLPGGPEGLRAPRSDGAAGRPLRRLLHPQHLRLHRHLRDGPAVTDERGGLLPGGGGGGGPDGGGGRAQGGPHGRQHP